MCQVSISIGDEKIVCDVLSSVLTKKSAQKRARCPGRGRRHLFEKKCSRYRTVSKNRSSKLLNWRNIAKTKLARIRSKNEGKKLKKFREINFQLNCQNT